MMMINRRRVCGGESLPYDAEIEYLQSSGTQLIKCDCEAITKVEICFKFTGEYASGQSSVAQQRVFSVYSSFDGLNVYVNGNRYIASATNKEWASNNLNLWRDKYVVVLDAAAKTTYCYNQYGESNSWGNSTKPTYGRGFRLFENNSAPYGSFVKIYYCKLYRNNTLVFDLIPVRKGQVGYMYDKISGSLLGNAGTGDFILGFDKTNDIHYVEYLQSVGNCFINTNVFGATVSGSEISVVASYQGTNSVQNVFGATSNGYFQINKTTTPNQFRLLCAYSGGDKFFTFADYANFHKYSVIGQELYIDDSLVQTAGGSPMPSMPIPFYLFGRNRGATVDQDGNGWRIVSCYINMSGKERDLVPVRIGQRGYFYDKITRRYIENIGSNNFIIGADITI